MPRESIRYIELKTGYGDNGPAWIDRVRLSKSGRSIHWRGKELLNIGGGGVAGNYMDIETREEYWVSGVKKDQRDRHRTGRGPVEIAPEIEQEYLKLIGKA